MYGCPAPLFPGTEGVCGGEGTNAFDDVSELCNGGVGSPRAGARVGPGVVGEGCDEFVCPDSFP